MFNFVRLRGVIPQSTGVRGRTIAYRPELDGIRTIAVSGVVLNHIGAIPQGGWGVNVFFVLSGYLITKILFKKADQPYLLSNFYIRRFSRLVPIAYIYVIFSYVLDYILKEPRSVSRLLATLLYVRNFFEHDGGWGHYWSLAAEEQFYFLWPLIFVTAVHFNSKKFLGFMSLAVFLSLQLFPFTDSSSWLEYVIVRPSILLLGSGIALLENTIPNKQIYILKYSLQVVGVCLFVTGLFAHWGSWNLGIVLLTASVLIIVPKQSLLVPKMLSLFPLPQIGLLSYSIYIWHFVPIKLGKILIQDLEIRLVVTAAAILILAFVSFTYVEKPLQRYFSRFERL